MRDLTDAAFVQTLRDDYMFQIIKHGGASLGKPGMPSWSQELDDREIRDLVVHIRSLAAPPQQPQATGSSR
jgi:mono/diheme cytochrome c family protein